VRIVTNDEQMDLWLWSQGVCQWHADPYSKSSTVPHELDYLRGIHNSVVLAQAASYLSRKTGLQIRLRTMWQDKHVYVRPTGGHRRELADIAVIMTREAKGKLADQRMWLLQAKVSQTPLSPFTGYSSAKEIELFEGYPGSTPPEFKLLRGRSKKFAFPHVFPAGAFKGPGHWAFLTLQRDPTKPSNEVMRERWPGSPTAPAHGSLFGALTEVVSGTRGEPVVLPPPSNDHWSILFDYLMARPSPFASTRHAVSVANPSGNAMQLSVLQQAADVLEAYWAICPFNADAGLRFHPHDRFDALRRNSFASSDFVDFDTSWDPMNVALSEQASGPPDRPDGQSPVEGIEAAGPPAPPKGANRFDRDPEEPGSGVPLIVFLDVRGEAGPGVRGVA
jgi:hypothetical protein